MKNEAGDNMLTKQEKIGLFFLHRVFNDNDYARDVLTRIKCELQKTPAV